MPDIHDKAGLILKDKPMATPCAMHQISCILKCTMGIFVPDLPTSQGRSPHLGRAPEVGPNLTKMTKSTDVIPDRLVLRCSTPPLEC